MAEIQEYLPQVAAPEAFGSVSPNVELAGAEGRGLERLGGDIAQGFEKLAATSRQEEVASTYSNFAQQRAVYTNRIQKGIDDGSLDMNQVLQDYDQESQDFGSKLDTPGGRNFFNRQQSRLRGELLRFGQHGMAQVAANQARGQWQSAFDSMAATVRQNPGQFDDALDSAQEAGQALVENSGLPAKDLPKFVQMAQNKLAEQAILGTAELDNIPGADGQQTTGPNAARAMLKGDFAKHLTPTQLNGLPGSINRIERDKETEQNQARLAIEREQKAKTEKWINDNYSGIQNGSVTIQKINQAQGNGDIDFKGAEEAKRILRETTNKDWDNNPKAYNNVVDLIHQGKIKDLGTLSSFVKPGGLNVQGFERAKVLLNSSEDAKEFTAAEKDLKKQIYAVTKQKGLSSPLGQINTLGAQKAAQALQDYADAKQKILKSGGDPMDLLRSDSPNSFYKRLDNYRVTPQEEMENFRLHQTNGANGVVPTKNNPTPAPTPEARKDNETALENLFRNPPPELLNALKKKANK